MKIIIMIQIIKIFCNIYIIKCFIYEFYSDIYLLINLNIKAFYYIKI